MTLATGIRLRPCALRGFDAIHVASALELKKRLNEPMTFAAADRPLLRAAQAEGLAPLDVEAGPHQPNREMAITSVSLNHPTYAFATSNPAIRSTSSWTPMARCG
jgi:hypothetical protein